MLYENNLKQIDSASKKKSTYSHVKLNVECVDLAIYRSPMKKKMIVFTV